MYKFSSTVEIHVLNATTAFPDNLAFGQLQEEVPSSNIFCACTIKHVDEMLIKMLDWKEGIALTGGFLPECIMHV